NDHAQRNPDEAILRGMEPEQWGMGDQPARPLRAAGAVLGDLADLRYDARWIGLPASAVGAPHPRFRVLILAHRAATDPARIRLLPQRRDPGSSASTSRGSRTVPSDHR